MPYRFEDIVLDPARRELRRDGQGVEVQPLVFELLRYLVDHRDRVVTKAELLDSLWADSAVTEASLSRAVSLARRALGDGDRAEPLIRTHPRVGYRFMGAVEVVDPTEGSPGVEARTAAGEERPGRAAPPSMSPASARPGRSSFARSGGTHIAYRIVGDGPVDVAMVNAWVLSISSVFDDPAFVSFLERLGRHARLILFDKRGTGLSDRVKELPGLARRMEDLTAVLDAVGSRRAHVLGVSEGAPMSLLYAASQPERVSGLALVGGFARMTRDADQPFGWSREDVDRLESYIRTRWGEGRSIGASLASRADDPATVAWTASAELIGCSPGAALELWNMNRSIDVRDVLPVLRTPCAVLHTGDDPVIDVAHGRQLADRIHGARYVELEGIDHMPFLGPMADAAIDALVEWIHAPAAEPEVRSRLAALLLVDFGAEPHAELELAVEPLLAAHRGSAVNAGDGAWAALFESPAQAARCALALRSSARRRADTIRCALVCAEVECREAADASAPNVVSGLAVNDARALLGCVADGEVWTTGSVVDLVPGSGLAVEAREAGGAGPFYAVEAS